MLTLPRFEILILIQLSKRNSVEKEDNSKNRGFSLVEVDTRYDIKTVLKEFYESMKEPVQIINIRQERI